MSFFRKYSKVIFLYIFVVVSALVMNLTHFNLRFFFFPLILIFSPLIVVRNFDLFAFLKPNNEGMKLFFFLSFLILIFFPPVFFLYFKYFIHLNFSIPNFLQIISALKKSLFLLILAALPEEIFFRAFLQETVFEKLSGKLFFIITKKNFIVSLLFGATHAIAFLDITRGATFFPSLLFGFIVEKSNKSIFYSIMFHAVANTLNFILFEFISK